MVGYYINKLNEKWESSIKGERRLDGVIKKTERRLDGPIYI